MSKGRVVAIYHRETRKVLGHVPVSVILRQTDGYRSEYKAPVRESLYDWGPGFYYYDVVHDSKGNPIKVIADSQKEASLLIRTEGLTSAEQTAAILNEPNALLEGFKV